MRVSESPEGLRLSELHDGFRLVEPGLGVEFELTRLRRSRDGDLIGELAVACGILGAKVIDGTLSVGTFNVSNPRARHERAKQLAERARTNGQVNWLHMLEELSQRVLAADRAGKPAVVLRTVRKTPPAEALEVDGLPILRHLPSILFGDGGTAKSFLALYVAGQLAARRGLTVLYLDWELSAEEHRERLERLFGATMPAVLYARCDRPLSFEIDRVRRLVQQDEVDFVICDSISFACDGPPEAAEVAARYFQALRQIGVGSLSLAHTNRSDRADEKPFGSSFWHNGARATWHVKLASPGIDTSEITVGLYNKKANLGPLSKAVGFQLAFGGERVTVRRIDPAGVEDLAEALPLWQRIKHAVQHQPLTLAALATELGANVESLDRTVRRKKQLFTRVTGADGIARVALLEGHRVA